MWFIELVEALAWPTVLVLALWYFRVPLFALLSRLNKVSVAGISAETGQSAASTPTDTPNSLEELRKIVSPDQLQPVIKHVELHVPRDVTTVEQRAEYFQTLAAALTVFNAHERTYISIFGSQIRFLRLIESTGQGSVVDAQRLYDSAATTFPDVFVAIPFERWLTFLIDSQLIDRHMDNHFRLTASGKGFLRFLGQRGLNEAKAL